MNSADDAFCRECGANLTIAPAPEAIAPEAAESAAATAAMPLADDTVEFRAPSPSGTARRRSGALPAVLALLVVLLGGGGAAAYVLLGNGHTTHPRQHHKRAKTTNASVGQRQSASQTGPSGPSQSSGPTAGNTGPTLNAAQAKVAIMSALQSYAADYSASNLTGLSALFASNIQRHGLSAGGCGVTYGKAAVLNAYQSQFSANGRLSYQLVGLSQKNISFPSTTAAYVPTSYLIPSSGNHGPVSFTFAYQSGVWLISNINATCHPSFGASTSAAAPNPAGAVATLESYWADIRDGDYAAAYGLLAPGAISQTESQFVASEQQARISSVQYAGTVTGSSGGSATITVDTLITNDAEFGCRSWTGSYSLAHTSGAWRIEGDDLQPTGC
jgi:hypothetical protein